MRLLRDMIRCSASSTEAVLTWTQPNVLQRLQPMRSSSYHGQTIQAHSFHPAILQTILPMFVNLCFDTLGTAMNTSPFHEEMHQHSDLHFAVTYMWVKLVPVALLLASSSLDMMLLSAGTVSCIPNMLGI